MARPTRKGTFLGEVFRSRTGSEEVMRTYRIVNDDGDEELRRARCERAVYAEWVWNGTEWLTQGAFAAWCKTQVRSATHKTMRRPNRA